MPGGTEKCIDPFGDHETLDIGVDECRGMCYVSTYFLEIISLLIIKNQKLISFMLFPVY